MKRRKRRSGFKAFILLLSFSMLLSGAFVLLIELFPIESSFEEIQNQKQMAIQAYEDETFEFQYPYIAEKPWNTSSLTVINIYREDEPFTKGSSFKFEDGELTKISSSFNMSFFKAAIKLYIRMSIILFVVFSFFYIIHRIRCNRRRKRKKRL